MNRRGFFRFTMTALAFALAWPRTARAQTTALDIHLGTRNTKLGPIGRALSRLRPAPAARKPYEGRTRIALARPSPSPSPSLLDAAAQEQVGSFSAAPVPLADVARVLYFANGVTGQRGGRKLRAAPSAGALYAGEVYLVATRVEGLDSGVYHYEPDGGDLARLAPEPPREALESLLEDANPIRDAAAIVLITNVFDRYQYKYANRGYRYALIDTGHIGENLRLAARSAGLGEMRPPRYRDDVANWLVGVDGREEAVCAVHVLGKAARGRTVIAGGRTLAEKQRVEPDSISARLPVTQRYQEATRLVPGTPSRDDESLARIAEQDRGTLVPLRSASPPSDTSVEAAISTRRSPAAFRRSSIDAARLATVLNAAMAPGRAGDPRNEMYVVINAVSGLERGLYRHDAQRGGLETVRSGDLRDALAQACLGQTKARDAAAVCFMVGRIERAAARHGERSYRDLLIESGEIGERVYLAAEAVGLAARNLAAFRDDELNELLGLDGRRRAVVHLTVLGNAG